MAYGVRFGVRVSEPGALPPLLERLPPAWRLSSSQAVDRLYSLVIGGAGARRGVQRLNLLYAGAALIAGTENTEEALERFESDVRLYVAERAPRRVFVHAGVVGWGGQAILIPGRSLSGKTTLVAELVRAGARYYSDEYAVLDAEGRVHPYARPLAVREGEDLKQTRRRVEEFGGRAGTRPLEVGSIIVSRYERGRRWNPRRLSPGEGVLEMLSNTVSARRSPRRVLAALTNAAKRATTLAGPRGEAVSAAESILKSLET
ncbi:MAG: hypothetical protein QOC61_2321 [Acidobacteriota bacterium]|nr:hypothetical protein [Acidobacteriota bacterium]